MLVTALEKEKEALKQEGDKNRQIKIAINMLGKNYPIEEISEMTGLTKEEILKLKNA